MARGGNRWLSIDWTFRCCVILCLFHQPSVSAVDPDSAVRSIRGVAQVQNGLLVGSDVSAVTSDAPDSSIPLASMTVPLHAHSGTHHVFVHIGSPEPQRQTLILDTGSRYVAFPCEPFCQNCGRHHSNKFNGTKSTTLTQNYYPNCIFAKPIKDPRRKDNSCIFHQTYLEGSSWTAKEMEDMMWLATADEEESIEEYMPHLAIPFVFGCQTSVTGHFVRQYADGILGMGRALGENAFLNTMVKADAIDRAAFATCLTRKGGTLSLGGSGLARPDNNNSSRARQYHVEPMRFTKIKPSGKGLYAIQIYKVMVGDVCITCGDNRDSKAALSAFKAGKGTLLDSGTTDTFFPKAALPIFRETWQTLAGFDMREYRQYTYEEYQRIPEITLHFVPNATLTMVASAYMENVPLVDPANSNAAIQVAPEAVQPWVGSRRLTMRIYCEEQSGATLGANAMYNYDVVYDLQEKRIGLARSYCGE